MLPSDCLSYISVLGRDQESAFWSGIVKTDIHPEYHVTVAQCACGNTFTTRSTLPSIHVEICGQCHPFFTGKQKLVDTAGRVERFRKRYAASEAKGA